MRSGFKRWLDLVRFLRLPRREKTLVFYVESMGMWPYFKPTIDSLTQDHGREILYVTSDRNDPVLSDPPSGVRAFYIGWGLVQIIFFETLGADVLVTSTPDLNTFHIKKSKGVGCFAYLHHSCVSTHMVYRDGAFDAFDAILCVGPHHVTETRAREKLHDLPEKRLLEHGYAPIDDLYATCRNAHTRSGDQTVRVLVAPSWGKDGLLETMGMELCQSLLDAGADVTVRPHPRTDSLRPDIRRDLTHSLGDNAAFRFDGSFRTRDALINADIMISDWSGAAFEFAFGLEKPVVFVDVPRKVNCPTYEELGIEPLEVTVRDTIGQIVAPTEVGRIGEVVRTMAKDAERWRERIRHLRDKWLFNFGHSGTAGAAAILELERSVA